MSAPASAPPAGFPSTRGTLSCTDSTRPLRAQLLPAAGSTQVVEDVVVVAHDKEMMKGRIAIFAAVRMTLGAASAVPPGRAEAVEARRWPST